MNEKNCIKILYRFLLKFIIEIFKLTINVSALSAVCAVKFEKSFAMRQHLFDIVTKPIDVDSNFFVSRFLVAIPTSPKM